MTTRITPKLAFMLTLPPVLWAGNAVIGRMMVGNVPPMALNGMRWTLALLVLLPLGWRVLRRPGDITSRWPHLALLGLLGVGCYNSLLYLALTTSNPINITLIAASLPVWMLGLGAMAYGVRPTRAQLMGATLSLLGVALVISRGSLQALMDVQLVPGDLFMLLAVALWAVYSWLLARPPVHMVGDARPDWRWSEFLLVQVMFGVAWAGVAAGTEAWVAPAEIRWSPAVFAVLAYVALGPSVIAYWFWGKGVSTVGPTIAAFFSNLTPVFAAMLSAALLGEPPHWYHGGAFALIVVGIVVSSRKHQKG